MFKKVISMLLAILLFVGFVPNNIYALDSSVELTIDGILVTNPAVDDLETAFVYLKANKPTTSAEIIVSGDQTTVTPIDFDNFDLTIAASAGTKPTLNLAAIRFRNGELKFSSFVINLTPNDTLSRTLTISTASGDDTQVTFDAVDLNMNGTGFNAHAIMLSGKTESVNTLNIVNGSKVFITGYTVASTRGNAIYTESEATHIINVIDSSFVSDGNRSGLVAGNTKTHVNITNSRFDVKNSRGNGSNGGHWKITKNSVVNFLDNTDHGLSTTSLTINNSEVNADRNGANGIFVHNGGLAADKAIIHVSANTVKLASQWTTPGALYIQGGTNTIKDSLVTITENLGPGLHLKGGTLVIDDSVELSVMNNRANRTDLVDGLYARGAGVYVSSGSLVLPDTAVIYNNRAALEADDIYVSQGAKLTLHRVGEAWFLNESPEHSENHVIDGWYIDSIENRWSAHGEAIFIELYTDLAEEVTGPLTLKAAHSIHEITVTKTWVDGPEERPDIVLSLLANGEPARDLFNEIVESVTLVNGETEYTFTDIPFYADNEEIEYTITEDDVLNYEQEIDGFDITNTYVIPLGDITAHKVWIGGPELHPDIQFQLLRDGDAYGLPVTLKDGELSYTWEELELTDMEGREYVFTVEEVETPENYITAISEDGLTVSNTYVSATIDITVIKIWKNTSGVHPDISIQLYRDGVAYRDPVVLKDGTTSYTWEDLELTDENGLEYVYTVDEMTELKDFTKVIDGFNITNTYTPQLPPTGVQGNINLALIVLLVGGLIFVLGVRRRRKGN